MAHELREHMACFLPANGIAACARNSPTEVELIFTKTIILIILVALAASCELAAPTVTLVPPTATAIPPASAQTPFLGIYPRQGCTIFYAADDHVALAGNNEDWSNPYTYVWFVPAEPGRYGRVYFGFEDGQQMHGGDRSSQYVLDP